MWRLYIANNQDNQPWVGVSWAPGDTFTWGDIGQQLFGDRNHFAAYAIGSVDTTQTVSNAGNLLLCPFSSVTSSSITIGNTTKVSLKSDLFYLYDKNGNRYYGGNQSWWDDDGASSAGRSSIGCAPVAAANIMAYLAKSNRNFWTLYPYSYTKEDFLKMMNTIWNYVTPGGLGYWWISDFAKGVVNYAKSYGASLTGHSCSHTLFGVSFNDAVKFVEDGLKKDCPVALEVFGCPLLFKGRDSLGMAGHYMVITSITDNRKNNGGVSVVVSSWGTKYVLDFETAYHGSLYFGLAYFTW